MSLGVHFFPKPFENSAHPISWHQPWVLLTENLVMPYWTFDLHWFTKIDVVLYYKMCDILMHNGKIIQNEYSTYTNHYKNNKRKYKNNIFQDVLENPMLLCNNNLKFKINWIIFLKIYKAISYIYIYTIQKAWIDQTSYCGRNWTCYLRSILI